MSTHIIRTIALAVILLAISSACANDDITEEGLAEQLLQQAVASMNDVQSVSFDASTDQHVVFADGEVPMQHYLEGDMRFDPLTLKLNMNSNALGQDAQIDLYFADDGFYVFDINENNWVQMPEQDFAIINTEQFMISTVGVLEQLLDFSDDVTVREDGDVYILEINNADNRYLHLIGQNLATDFVGTEMFGDTLEGWDLQQFLYQIKLDRDTHRQVGKNIQIESEIETEQGTTMTMRQDITENFFDFDEHNELSIPDEIREGAIEFELPDEIPNELQ